MQPLKNNKTQELTAVGEILSRSNDFKSLQQCYGYIIENAHEGIWMVNAMGVTTYVNDRVAKMLGTTVENMRDRTTFDFFFEEDYEDAFQVSARCSKRVLEDLDFRLKKIDGTEIWAHITLAPMKDKNGNFAGSIGMLSDITEQRKIEQALSDSEEQYRIFFNQGLVGAVEAELFTGKILSVNKRACEILGYTEQELKKSTAFELIYKEDQEKYFDNYARLSAAEIPFYTTEKRYVRKDGSVVWTNMTIGMVKNNKGMPLHTAAIIIDITDHKTLQEKLLTETETRQRNLIKAVIRGQENERQLIGRELHDSVIQVLAVIKLYNEASLTADEAGRLQFIHKSIKYLNECMKEIRTISKSLAIPNFDNISLADSVNEMVSSIGAINKLNITLSNEIGEVTFEEEIQVAAYRVIQEHLTNILKHSDAIQSNISLKIVNNSLKITIIDNGKGFDFKQKRNGIGITNMINRVEAANGQIEFITSKGNGCTLLVMFPNTNSR